MMARTVWETLFPTLKDWKITSLLEKIIAIVSSPAVFLLTLTLPVVDETAEDVENQEELGRDDAQEEEEESQRGLALGVENRRVLDGLEDSANGGQGAKDGADRGPPFRPDSPQKAAAHLLAGVLRKELFRSHGLPDKIVSDRVLVFVSEFWRTLLTLLNIKLAFSAAYHPQTDGSGMSRWFI
jgi:hypothetical protein